MSKIRAYPRRSQIEAEACAWIAQFDCNPPSEEDLTAFREWINRSPEHAQEIKHLSALWSDLNVLTELAVPMKPGKPSPSNRLGLAAATFAVVALFVAAVIALRLHPQPRLGTASTGVVYSTTIGEQKPLSLVDQSKILLNTNSRIQVDYRVRQREIRLLQGEAYFEVSHDPERPFLVYAGANIVRAVGTAFTVRLRNQDVEVVVTEGTVELSSMTSGNDGTSVTAVITPTHKLADLNAGQRADFNKKLELIQPVEPAEMKRSLSWREGILSFAGEPLQQVVEEVNRYNPVTVVISDPAIRNVRIGGYFKVGETDALMEALDKTFNVRVRRVNDHLIYLSAK